MSTAQALPELRVEPARAALLIVDVQERLAAVMPAERLVRVVRAVRVLVELARRFEIPVVVTQQYPQGLGPTLSEVELCLEGLGPLVHRLDKVDFSVCSAPDFEPIWKQLGRSQWIITGMETHVCVYQTVRHLCERGAQAMVAVDGVVSRDDENREVGLSLMGRCGAVLSSAETIVFDALGVARGDDFKALSRLLK